MRRFSARLLDWYRIHGRRDLPWQRDPTPYRVWVSEVMLQQTQVATVIPYYQRFVERLPSVERLAATDLDEVLSLWSGIGYYARGRNLHRAARIVAESCDGLLPITLEALMELPGIGRSTASAILALSGGQRHAILDGNVKRVLARYHAVEGWSGERAVETVLWQHAEEHTPIDNVAEYTQAIMDLGATLCTRRDPACAICPVMNDCAARQTGRQSQLPTPRPKRHRPRRAVTALLVLDPNKQVLLERRTAEGIWGGLFSFPELPDECSARQWCNRHLGTEIAAQREHPPVAHAFTHFDLDLKPLEVQLNSLPNKIMDREDWLWYNAATQTNIGVATPIAKLLQSLLTAQERLIA